MNLKRVIILSLSVLLISILILDFSFFESNKYTSAELKAMAIEKKAEKRKNGYAKRDTPEKVYEAISKARNYLGETSNNRKDNYKYDLLDKFRKEKKTKKKSDLNWISRGPANVGGRTRALVVDESDPDKNTWIAASVGGGIWKSTDRGLTWSNLSDDQLPNLAFSSLVQAKSNSNVFYAGSGEGFGNLDAIRGAGIFKSIDKGITWFQLDSTVTSDFYYVNRIIVDPSDENIVLVATNTGVFKSINGGTSWVKTLNASDKTQHIISLYNDFTVQFATVNSVGIYKSIDSGDTWRKVSESFGGNRIEIDASRVNTNYIFASIEVSTESSILAYSKDAGSTWITTNSLNTVWLGGQGWYDNIIKTDPLDLNKLYVGGINFFQITMNYEDSTSIQTIYTGFDDEWMGFINWGGSEIGGGLGTGTDWDANLQVSDRSANVEVRFGPGRGQLAHRFDYVENLYTYLGYDSVPFEVYDIENNQQLMVSIRDNNQNGTWDLLVAGSDAREYVYINDVVYADTASSLIAFNGDSSDESNGFLTAGANNLLMYAYWPSSDDGGITGENLPESNIIINRETIEIQTSGTISQLSVSSPETSSSYIHADQHSVQFVFTDEEANEYYAINTGDGGIFYNESGNFDTWSSRNTGYVTNQFYGVDRHPTEKRYFGGMQDNGSWISSSNPLNNSAWVDAGISGDGFDGLWNKEDPNKMIATVQFGLSYLTKDGGNTWQQILGYNTTRNAFLTNYDNFQVRPNNVYHPSNVGLDVSTNFGENFETVEYPGDFGDYIQSLTDVRISRANPDIVWVSTVVIEDGGTSAILSRDAGKTFEMVNSIEFGNSFFTSGLGTHPTEEGTAYILASVESPKVVRTTDFGDTWENISGIDDGALPDVDIYSILVIPDTTQSPYPIWLGTEVGIFVSNDDGVSWSYSNFGLPAVAVWEMKIVENEVVVTTHGRGAWTVELENLYTDYGESQLTSTLNFVQNPSYKQNAYFIVKLNHPLKSSSVSYTQLGETNTMTLKEYDASTFSYFANMILDGNSTIEVNASFTSNLDDQTIEENYSITTLHNNGKADKIVNDNVSIAIDEHSFSNFHTFLVTGDKVKDLRRPKGYDKTNYKFQFGFEGQALESSVDVSIHVDALTIDKAKLFYLNKNSWELIDAKFYNNGEIRAKIDKQGVYKVFLSKQNNDLEKIEVFSYELNQNYPNPFNPLTTIKYSIDKSGPVKLEIFNVLGQKVKTLVDEIKDIGTHSIEWNGTNNKGRKVSSGIYFYQIISNNKIITKKMNMIK